MYISSGFLIGQMHIDTLCSFLSYETEETLSWNLRNVQRVDCKTNFGASFMMKHKEREAHASLIY